MMFFVIASLVSAVGGLLYLGRPSTHFFTGISPQLLECYFLLSRYFCHILFVSRLSYGGCGRSIPAFVEVFPAVSRNSLCPSSTLEYDRLPALGASPHFKQEDATTLIVMDPELRLLTLVVLIFQMRNILFIHIWLTIC